MERRINQFLLYLQEHTSDVSVSGQPIYFLEMSSMTDSIAWITGFINYVDDKFSQYRRGILA